MMINALIKFMALAVVAAMLAGCSSNPTNEPSAADIRQANAKRAAAIDEDPTLTPEGRKKMKEMLHLDGSQAKR